MTYSLSLHAPKTLSDTLVRAWSWWSSELAGLLPAWVVRRAAADHSAGQWLFVSADDAVFGSVSSAPVDVRTLVQREGGARSNPRAHRQGPVTIRLDPKLVFEMVIELPLAAEVSPRLILAHHIGLLVPLEPEEMEFDHALLSRDADAMILRLVVAVTRRATLDRACDTAWQIGLDPERAVIGRGGEADARFDFLRFRAGPKKVHKPRIWHFILEAVAGLLLLSAFATHSFQAYQERARIAKAISAHGQIAETIRDLRQHIDAISDRVTFLGGRLAAPRRLALLDTLTRLLPADTWITQLRIQGSDIELVGSTPHAASLIGLIAGMPDTFEPPRFQAPITTGPDGRERFDMAITVRRPAAQ